MHNFAKWREALNLAPNVRAVEGIMRDYLEVAGPALAALPDDCRSVLKEPLDVQAVAVTLMRAELRARGDAEDHSFLHEIAHTFASAAVRIAQLHSVALPEPMPRMAGAAAAGR